ncbi:MAG: RpoL/Rpb11 RNA polymerase subunit family protein [Candidatus Poseidoniaceae archaeon]
MPVKVLARDANELRVRFIGESHTSLQILRERLNNDKGVDYANYFPGHPDLDEPEFFIRTKGKTDPADILKKLIGEIQGDFNSLKI